MVSQHVRNYDRARSLETLCRVWESNRSEAMAEAMSCARAAKDERDEGLLRRARRQREPADMFGRKLKRTRDEPAKLRKRL